MFRLLNTLLYQPWTSFFPIFYCQKIQTFSNIYRNREKSIVNPYIVITWSPLLSMYFLKNPYYYELESSLYILAKFFTGYMVFKYFFPLCSLYFHHLKVFHIVKVVNFVEVQFIDVFFYESYLWGHICRTKPQVLQIFSHFIPNF